MKVTLVWMTTAVRRLLLSLCLIFSAAVVCGQTVRKIAVRQKLSTATGLSSYNVNKILQDRYGYIWVATQDGLNRYDGRHFIVYTKSSGPQHRLLGNVINDMVEDTLRNCLWVTTSYGGINSIDLVTGTVNRSVKSLQQEPGFVSDWLKCIALVGNELWIGTPKGLHVYDIGSGAFIPIPQNMDIVNAIVPDRFGHVWVSLPKVGLAVYNAKAHTLMRRYDKSLLKLNETMVYYQFSSRFILLNDTSFLWATDHGLKVLNFDSAGNIVRVNDDLPVNRHVGDKKIYTCAIDKHQQVWFSTFDRLYTTRLDDSSFAEVRDVAATPNNDYLQSVLHIFFDRDEHLWLGTQNGAGLCDVSLPAIIPYYRDRDGEHRIAHAYSIHPVSDSIVFVGAQDGLYAVDVWRDGIRKISAIPRFNYIFEATRGKLVFSNEKGLFVMDGEGKLISADKRFAELKSIQHEVINSSVRLGDTVILLSSESSNLIFRWDLRQHSVSEHTFGNDPVYQNIVNKLYLDRAGKVWMLFDNAFAIHEPRRPDSVVHLADPELGIPLSIFMDVCESAGDYWLAVYGKGVVRLDQQLRIKRIFGIREGLTNTGVYKVIPYGDSTVFVTTNYGLFSIPVYGGRIRQLLDSDGLNSNSFEENCAAMSGHVLYAGGEQGFSRVDPRLFRTNSRPPELFISSIACETPDTTAEVFDLHLQRFVIPPAARQTLVHFSALNFSAPQQVTYSYQIAELNTGWVELGNTNYLSLIGLAPREYSLQVRAANENGIWSEPKTLMLQVQPRWYQTTAFKALLWLLSLGLVYGFYRYRLHQLQVRQRMRKEIAADLHDDVGSTLNSAKIYTHLAKRDSGSHDYLTLAEQSVSDAMSSMRDIMWVLDDTQDGMGDLADRICRFAEPVARARNIDIDCVVDPVVRSATLTKEEKKTFFLVAKEAINNAVKHADCTCISIRIDRVDGAHRMVITDNGKGYPKTINGSGYGLNNMRNRARQIGYMLVTENAAAGGATVRLFKQP